MVYTILQIAFGFALLIQFIYWCGLFSRIIFHRSPKYPKRLVFPNVSVVICAKNEAENLSRCLPKILEQNYPNYEVIVVNDASSDDTRNVLTNFLEKYSHLNVIHLTNVNRTMLGKKFALTEGIKKAKYQQLLLTDADCYPTSKNWIQGMVNAFEDKKGIVLGLGPFEKSRGFTNKFIRFEGVLTAIQYVSYALAGLPYMGVGRNLMYDKKLFDQVGGFRQNAHIRSGDDDLFINQIANQNNTSVCLNPDTYMVSEPKTTFKSYYNQKARHLTTGQFYHWKHKVLLGGFSLSHFCSYVGFPLFFVGNSTGVLLFFLYVVRLFFAWVIFNFIANKINEKDLKQWFPLLDLGFILYYLIFTPNLFRTNTKEWKK